MCSIENGRPTCNNLNSKSETPSELNLSAVIEIYGTDGYIDPNNNIRYEERFAGVYYLLFQFSSSGNIFFLNFINFPNHHNNCSNHNSDY